MIQPNPTEPKAEGQGGREESPIQNWVPEDKHIMAAKSFSAWFCSRQLWQFNSTADVKNQTKLGKILLQKYNNVYFWEPFQTTNL